MSLFCQDRHEIKYLGVGKLMALRSCFWCVILLHHRGPPLRVPVLSLPLSSFVLHTINLDKDAAVVPVLYFTILHFELQQDWQVIWQVVEGNSVFPNCSKNDTNLPPSIQQGRGSLHRFITWQHKVGRICLHHKLSYIVGLLQKRVWWICLGGLGLDEGPREGEFVSRMLLVGAMIFMVL